MGTSIENLVNSGDISIETILSEAKEFSKGYFIHSSGVVLTAKRKAIKIVKGTTSGKRKQYRVVGVRINGCRKFLYVHRLVAEHFITKIEGKLQVNHIDGDTFNNHKDNLEWVDKFENMQHAVRIGLHKGRKGEKCNFTKTTEDVVRTCYTMRLKGYTYEDIMLKTGLTKGQVAGIVTHRTWRHITEPLERATTIPNGSTQ